MSDFAWCRVHSTRPAADIGEECRDCEMLMVTEPRRWPHLTVLPLVRRESSGDPTADLAVITHSPLVRRPAAYRVLVGASVYGRTAHHPVVRYDDAQSMLDEWRVD